MESLSSYTITNITNDQFQNYLELTKLTGITCSAQIIKIMLQMLNSGIKAEAIYHLLIDIKKLKKKYSTKL